MIVLVLDTCFSQCAAGIYDSEAQRLLAHEQAILDRGHAEVLAPMVQRVLAAAEIASQKIDRVAVTHGPGTFTGLRIGLSFARAFGLARGIPVIGLDSLTAVAKSDRLQAGPWLVAHKAGQSGYYYVLRDQPGAQPELIKAEDLQFELQGWSGHLLGTGAVELAQVTNVPAHAALALPDLVAMGRYAAGVEAPVHMPEPLYLREADAKPQGPQGHLRRVTGADAEALAEIHQQCFSHGWPAADLAAMLAIAGTQGIAIMNEGEMEGFVIERSLAGDSEILTLAVLPKSRQHGKGKALLQAAMSSAEKQKATRMLLEVSEANAPALALYASAGFAETGRRKAYYETPEGWRDAILMARSLP